jgi:hypothetical protein
VGFAAATIRSTSSGLTPRLSAFAYAWMIVAWVSMSLSALPRTGSSAWLCPVFTSSSRGVIVIPSSAVRW